VRRRAADTVFIARWVARTEPGCHHGRLMREVFGFWFYGGPCPA